MEWEKERSWHFIIGYIMNAKERKTMKPLRLFEAELAFTKAYQKHINDPRAIREAACVITQMPYTLAMRKEGDYFGGRYKGHRIGFILL